MIDLSIVIPLHNEAARLSRSIERLYSYLACAPMQTEVILVENGSTDNTADIMQRYKNTRRYSLPVRGKGIAVRYGMLQARGRWRMMADCDWSMPPDWITAFWDARRLGSVLIGSREASNAIRVGEPWKRHAAGRVFNSLVQTILPGIRDSQCGYKMFFGPAALDIFGLQTLSGLSFDVEILYIARRLGYATHEIPVYWVYDPDSRVRLVRDSLAMARDILTIRRNASQGIYQVATS